MFCPTTLTPMRPSLVAIAAAATLLVVGCSDSGESADTTTVSATGTLADSTAPTTKNPPTTTSAPTTTSTVAPTTTIDPTTQLIADIEADLNAGEQALFAAGADPTNPALRSALEQYYSGTSIAAVTKFLDGLVTDGLLMRPSATVPSTITVQSIETVDDPATAAVIVMCRVDSSVVFEPLGQTEVIVNDQVSNTTSSSRVFLINETWRLDGGSSTEERPGVTTCE
jgi:hypothetical protein